VSGAEDLTMNIYPESLKETAFGSMWYTLPRLEGTVDPFDFRQRMASLKLLIDCTNEYGIFGDDNALNVFWGYVFQTHWQWRSRRYALDGAPEAHINPNSLWGYSNYYLIVLPLIAAIDVAMAPDLEVLPPNSASKVEYPSGRPAAGTLSMPPPFVPALAAWKKVFRLIKQTSPGGDLEPIRFQLWKAHGVTLRAASRGQEPLVRGYSRHEVAFLSGWVRMVDFLELAAWRTDIDFMLKNGLDVLPERLLTNKDVPGHMNDQSEQVNSNVKSVFNLVKLPGWRFNINLWLWRRAMRTRAARDDVLAMLDATFHPSRKNVAERRKLLRYILSFSRSRT
jgi:hypothetical protein